MGTKMALVYGIIFTESVENSFPSSFLHKPTVCYRIIDDIFMTWSYGIDKFKLFLYNTNNTHPNITFTYEPFTTLHFMDVLMNIIYNNTIYTTVQLHSYVKEEASMTINNKENKRNDNFRLI